MIDPLEFLERAVRTPSHDDVGPMRDLLCETLREAGVEPTVDDADNVVATHEASGDAADGPHVVLNTHLDTVSPHVPAERDGDLLHGRGACDAKGPLAAMVAVFSSIEPDRGRITLAVTPDEETRSIGAAALVPSLDLDPDRGDAVIVGEPTGLNVCNAAKGRFEGRVTITGERAHAAEPHTGRNAIAMAAPVIDALATFDDRAEGLDTYPDLGAPTLTPTLVTGGEATNQVPADCEIVLDRRSVLPETAVGFETALNEYLGERVPSPDAVSFALTDRETPFLEAFETPDDARVVSVLQEASGGAVRPFTAATEASYFAREAPTVVFGPGDLADEDGPVAHADREYVRLSAVERATTILGDALAEFLRETDV
ncbi:M20 family metallopeptidase [Halococcus saccharolyticus]|uniref:Succinyl-diaminopimelate desuccinylase n=1 Tax=Halococcus saccharolyticus DSM 5350 TaxID=1227455 RepID=M0MJR5_9EURY|nr:M20 family metallopeptidase [Halococcus saccharolyticus]EMA44964.1 succinyl-diaminopimelate desuccinylase [Halococcus saccharolyticus DSM 5350]